MRPLPEALDVDIYFRNPKLGVDNERLLPTKDLMEVRISPLPHQVMNICTSLTEEEEHGQVNQLTKMLTCSYGVPLICPR